MSEQLQANNGILLHYNEISIINDVLKTYLKPKLIFDLIIFQCSLNYF